jgi:prolyl-tRNA editing enzyme YbaK/EbsC (Cys-tRNA(Pro) deacylase)
MPRDTGGRRPHLRTPLNSRGRVSAARDLRLGRLDLFPAAERTDLLAPSVAQLLEQWEHAGEVLVAEIDPDLADTAAFCERYDIGLDVSANCVVIAARRGETTRYAACVVLATTRADVNGVVRRHLDARKASFAPMDDAVAQTAMEYGGITPLGLPGDWPVLVDRAVVDAGVVVVGSGIRRSKLALPGRLLAELPTAELIDGLARPLA